MLKCLAILGMALVILCADSRANKVEARNDHQQPTQPTPAIPAQQQNPTAQYREQPKDVHAEVKIVNPPEKDFYDKAPVWINLALGIVGCIGIMIGVATLRTVKRQVDTYVGKERARLTMDIQPYDPLKLVQPNRVTLIVTNHGSTNAFIGKARSAAFIKRTDWGTNDLALNYGLQMNVPTVIPPFTLKEPVPIEESITYEADVDGSDREIIHNLLREEKNSVFVVGFVEFEDVFGNRWRFNFSRCWGGMYSEGQWFFTHEWMTWPTYPDGEEKIKKPPSRLQKFWKRFMRRFWTSIPFNRPPTAN
jgi:hypothetical protein